MSSQMPLPGPLTDSTVLVTGGSGFIAGHLLKELALQGASSIAVGRNASGPVQAVDLADFQQVDRIFKASSRSKRPIEYVFHLAGQKSAGVARGSPLQTLTDGFQATACILEAARLAGSVKSVVLVSSFAVYGQEEDGSSALLIESDPIKSETIYAATKVTTESLGLAYYKDFALPVCVARLSNVYGPGQSEAAVIPSLINQMRSGRDISMGNVEPVRDFVHVSDVVSALLAMAKSSATAGKVLNVCTGRGTSVQTIADMLTENLQYRGSISIDHSKIRPDEKLSMIGDNSGILAVTGWTPSVTIEDGLKALCR